MNNDEDGPEISTVNYASIRSQARPEAEGDGHGGSERERRETENSSAPSSRKSSEADEPVETNSAKWKLAFMVREYKKLQEAFDILARAEAERIKLNKKLALEIERVKKEIEQCEVETRDFKENTESEVSIKDQLQKERNRAKLLKQDHSVLARQLDTLKNKNDDLIEKKGLFESSIEKLQEKIAQLSSMIDGDGETTLANQLRAVELEKSDAAFRKLFQLDDNEYPIARYNCMNSKMMPGYIYISPNFITFATTMFPKSNQVKIAIKQLKQVKKARFAHLIDNSLKLVTVTGEAYAFSGFLKRNSCYKNICTQANKFKLDLGQMV